MISYPIYKIIHISGVLMLFLALGGMLLNRTRPHPEKKLISITHGISLVFLLIGGFGALARLGFVGTLPGWAMAKLAIWVVFAAGTFFMARRPTLSLSFWWITLSLGVVATVLATTKPF
ncbi:MAG: hypothetical protein A2X94_08150 [Bdellovibrionales bacterium GWB1_55_8]|nr:MAG: hypothetical protein A2X94_08150 [Bdellovibrionales bacterium GWB1_55_8]